MSNFCLAYNIAVRAALPFAYTASGEKMFHILQTAVLAFVVEWWWRVVIHSMVLKGFAVVLAICSTMVIWSECVFFIANPVLSLFAIFIKQGDSKFTYISIEVSHQCKRHISDIAVY